MVSNIPPAKSALPKQSNAAPIRDAVLKFSVCVFLHCFFLRHVVVCVTWVSRCRCRCRCRHSTKASKRHAGKYSYLCSPPPLPVSCAPPLPVPVLVVVGVVTPVVAVATCGRIRFRCLRGKFIEGDGGGGGGEGHGDESGGVQRLMMKCWFCPPRRWRYNNSPASPSGVGVGSREAQAPRKNHKKRRGPSSSSKFPHGPPRGTAARSM